MPKRVKENQGIVNLLCYYKKIFRTPENVNHYSEPDLRAAEKKFLKYLLGGCDPTDSNLASEPAES